MIIMSENIVCSFFDFASVSLLSIGVKLYMRDIFVAFLYKNEGKKTWFFRYFLNKITWIFLVISEEAFAFWFDIRVLNDTVRTYPLLYRLATFLKNNVSCQLVNYVYVNLKNVPVTFKYELHQKCFKIHVIFPLRIFIIVKSQQVGVHTYSSCENTVLYVRRT